MEVLYKNLAEDESTSFERDNLFSVKGIKWDKEFNINENTYPIEELQEKNIFLEGVAEYLGVSAENTDLIIEMVEKCYSQKGIKFTKTIRQWLQGKKKPSKAQYYRYNCYDFCIALGMDINATADFMFKYFQVMPFYYKNRDDAIYFYCILHNKSYSEITQLREIAKTFPAVNNETVHTQSIGKRISEIDDDEEFLSFLKENCYDENHQFATARQNALELLDKCRKLSGTNADSQLLLEISGYNNQTGIKGGRHDKGISKSKFPQEFTLSFPDDNVISKVRNNEKVSDESLRKLIILLEFYYYYADRDKKSGQEEITVEFIQECREDFCCECNAILYECGYVQLYPRNMYDWHILCCANSAYPVDSLKSLIKQKYADEMDKE